METRENKTSSQESKQQELAAIAAMRKIIEELDHFSFLYLALDGFFDDAEQDIFHNITDSLNNYMAECGRRAETAEAEVVKLKAKLYDYMTAGK